MVKLSACVIVKNEEKHMPRWLACVRQLADEMIVVDTGSEDRSVELARFGGAQVFSFPWQDDFSAAKNFALEKACGTWILFLDADEYFPTASMSRVRPLLEEIDRDIRTAGILCRWVSLDEDSGMQMQGGTVQLRLFRNLRGLRYKGRIYEALDVPKRYKVLATREIEIHHTGYSKTLAADKLQRNRQLLQVDIAAAGGRASLLQSKYLLDCAYGLGEWEEACHLAEKILADGRIAEGLSSDNLAVVYIEFLSSLMELGCPLAEIERVEEAAERALPTSAEFPWLLGLHFHGQRDPRAKELLQRGMSVYEECQRQGEMDDFAALGDNAYYLLPAVRKAMEESASNADATAEKAIAAVKSFLHQHLDEVDIPLEAMIEEMEPIFRENGWRRLVEKNPAILLLHSEANGDFVMSSALIREIRHNYPGAFITLLVPENSMELSKRCPYVDEVIIRRETAEIDDWRLQIAGMLETLPRLLEHRYSLGFSWNEARGASDKLWLYLAGVCRRIGYGPYIFEEAEMKPEAKLWYDMLTLSVPRDRGEVLRDSEKALRLLEALTGKTVEDRSLEVWTDEEDEKAAAAVLRDLRVRGYRQIYALMPGVSEERRRWPVDRWARLSEAILAREPRTAIVILGGHKEQEIAKWLEEELNKNFRGRVVSAAGKLTFSGTAALLKRCQKYLGNDTGAVHLSVAQKVPVLVAYAYPLDLKLHSVSMPVRFAPWGVPAVQVFPKEHRDDCHDIDGPGCSRKDEAHCILGISVETMLYAYEALNMQIAKGAQKPIRFC